MKMSPHWQGSLNDLEAAVGIVNGLNWNLSFGEQPDGWILYGADKPIGTFQDRAELEAFVFGMALALGVLPLEILDQIRSFIE